jgi:methylated-DNA-[protein]-cysteine S-methyltransferase
MHSGREFAMTRYTHIESPLGPMLLMSDGAHVTGLHFQSDRYMPPVGTDWIRDDGFALFAETVAQIARYFAGELTRFDLPIAPSGTAFQQIVWKALRDIPHGTTESYGQLARRIGQPTASRAVGAANSRNPISIIVPCHRVIGADGSLTGYAGGMHRKQALLALERCGTGQLF